MQLQYISDIHLEFFKTDTIKLEDIITPVAPYLAIVGDLGYPSSKIYDDFISQCSEKFVKVFIISGNHEYYTSSIDTRPTMSETNCQIVLICSKYPNVFFLNNSEYKLDDKTIILGSTLWSHVPDEKKYLVKQAINDYRNIYVINDRGYKVLVTTVDTNQLFNENVKWLTGKLMEHADKSIIILTHHLPTYKLIAPQFETSDINSAFASDLDHIMESYSNIKYWICGHTHTANKLQINQCQCLINPVGYENENPTYDRCAVIH